MVVLDIELPMLLTLCISTSGGDIALWRTDGSPFQASAMFLCQPSSISLSLNTSTAYSLRPSKAA